MINNDELFLKEIDIIYNKKTLEVPFVLEKNGKKIEVILKNVDQNEILQDIVGNRIFALELYKSKQLHRFDIDEKEWEEEIKSIRENPNLTPERKKIRINKLKEEKPQNRAEQLAQKTSISISLLNLLPQYIFKKDGTKLFNSEEQIKQFIFIARTDKDIMKSLIEAYVQYGSEKEIIESELKNELKGVSLAK